MSDTYLGIDIGGTYIKWGVIDAAGEILSMGVLETKVEEGVEYFLDHLYHLTQEHKDVLGVGICTAGIVDSRCGVVVGGIENIPYLKGLELRALLEKYTGKPVRVLNDVRAAALGENWMGAGKGCENLFCITIGTGLGGALMHTTKSGVAQFAVDTEEEGIGLIKKLISYMPQNNMEDAPLAVCTDKITRLEDSLNEIIPDSANKPYDMTEVIRAIVDNGEFLESAAGYAKNIITCFARFNGQSVGIIANQPKFMAGVLDINASRKAARFVRFCDAFNIPIVTLVDVPGFLPGTTQEYGGVITHGAKLLFAYCEATVPKITVTLRKAYGGAYIVMSSKHIRGDINYAWPTAEIAVMGASGAVEVLYGKELKELADKPEEKAKFIAEKEQEYNDKFSNPYNAARYGYIDDVIEPRNTRFRVIRALQSLATKRLQNPAKKHSNIPL